MCMAEKNMGIGFRWGARECHIHFVGDWVLTFIFWLKIPSIMSLPTNSFYFSTEERALVYEERMQAWN